MAARSTIQANEICQMMAGYLTQGFEGMDEALQLVAWDIAYGAAVESLESLQEKFGETVKSAIANHQNPDSLTVEK